MKRRNDEPGSAKFLLPRQHDAAATKDQIFRPLKIKKETLSSDVIWSWGSLHKQGATGPKGASGHKRKQIWHGWRLRVGNPTWLFCQEQIFWKSILLL